MKVVVRILVSILILVLAIASVANIHTRAVQLHANGGWQTWGISIGFAVTFALFAYMLIAFKKGFFFGAAAFGAILTSVMQTGMYRTLGADWVTSLGFGCGGPILEALLAMSEHYMDEPTKKGAPSAVWSRIGNALASRIEQGAQPNATKNANAIAHATQPEPQLLALEVPAIALPSTVLEAYNMRLNNIPIAEIAGKIGKSERTVNNYIAQAKAQLNGHGPKAAQ